MSGTTYQNSQKNTLKRDDTSGTRLVAGPSVAAYSGALLYVTNVTIPHNLGYTPPFRFYYEPFGDGVIWPALSGRLDGNAQQPTNTSNQGPGLVAWADSTNLYLQLFAGSNTFQNNTYPVYWVIYRDFSLS